MSISDYDLRRVNEARRLKGQQPLTRPQAVAVIDRRTREQIHDSSGTDFLLGLCGVPWPSIAGMVGYSIHGGGSSHAEPSHFTSDTSSSLPSNDTFGSGGGDYGGGGSSSSYDSGSSSSGGSFD